MASNARDRMIEGAAILLAKNGLQATSFSEVLDYTGAPRGSIYHHFPGGKEQLIDAAIDLAGGRAVGAMQQWHGLTAVEVTERFLNLWRSVLSHSSMTAGCAVLAVTIATDSPDLLAHAATIFRDWRHGLTELFVAAGMRDAERFATTLIAATEGAVVLARAEQSMEPFELVATELVARAAG
jgi:TetR/AcrR family transcriptional regulator, lmrAB and yxaGH operons repressor